MPCSLPLARSSARVGWRLGSDTAPPHQSVQVTSRLQEHPYRTTPEPHNSRAFVWARSSLNRRTNQQSFRERITMNTVGPLESQHREVERLFFRVANATDSETRTQLFAELADQVLAYATIEDKTVSHPWVSVRTAKAIF
jgi:hypothetical protein